MQDRFYAGPPYNEKDQVYIVEIDQFAILQNRRCYVFQMSETKYEFVKILTDVDFLCTDRVSSCIGIYAEHSSINALGHMSVSCGLLRDKVKDIQTAIDTYCLRDDADIQFYLYGGTPNTYELVGGSKQINASLNSGYTIETTPQLLNRDQNDTDGESEDEKIKLSPGETGDGADEEGKDDVITIFQCKNSLFITKYDAILKKTNSYVKAFGCSILMSKGDCELDLKQVNLIDEKTNSKALSTESKIETVATTESKKVDDIRKSIEVALGESEIIDKKRNSCSPIPNSPILSPSTIPITSPPRKKQNKLSLDFIVNQDSNGDDNKEDNKKSLKKIVKERFNKIFSPTSSGTRKIL